MMRERKEIFHLDIKVAQKISPDMSRNSQKNGRIVQNRELNSLADM